MDTIYKVQFGENLFTYARRISKFDVAIYDYVDDGSTTDLNIIVVKAVLFQVTAHKSVPRNKKWIKIGNVPQDLCTIEVADKFKQDIIHPEDCSIVKSNGEIVPASYEECVNLERCAVWEADHIQERIKSNYEGKPSIVLKHMGLDPISQS